MAIIDYGKKLDLYLELAKMGFDRYHIRRNIEWKINVGFWFAFGIFLGFGLTGNSELLSYQFNKLEVWLFHTIAFVAFAVWRVCVSIANKVDQGFGFFYTQKLEITLGGRRYNHEEKMPWLYKKLGKSRVIAPAAQFAITILIIAFNLIIYLNLASG